MHWFLSTVESAFVSSQPLGWRDMSILYAGIDGGGLLRVRTLDMGSCCRSLRWKIMIFALHHRVIVLNVRLSHADLLPSS